MDKQYLFKIGYVSKTHGLKGEVTVVLSPNTKFEKVQTLFIEHAGTIVPFFLESISLRPDKAFIKLKGIDSLETARQIKGGSIYLEKSKRPKADRGDFHDDEVKGFEVTDQFQKSIGTVQDVANQTGSRFLLVINNGKEIIIPVEGPFIKSINKAKKKITVDLPDGFLEI